MMYDLNSLFDRKRFATRANTLYVKKKIVELREVKPARTLRQNRYLHLIIGWYALETGNTIEYVKQKYFKELCNAAIFVEIRHDPHLGETKVLRSSKDCDTGQITLAIERFRTWSSAECGIYLPEPNETEFLQHIDVELSHKKEWV